MPKLVVDKPRGRTALGVKIEHADWDKPENLAVSQINMQDFYRSYEISAGLTEGSGTPFVFSDQPLSLDKVLFDDPLNTSRTLPSSDFLNRRLYNDGLLVLKSGELVHESYRNGLTKDDRHVIHSCSKSACAMLAAIAIDKGMLDPNRFVNDYINEFSHLEAWQDVRVKHVLDMQAGILYSEDYSDPKAHYWSYTKAAGYYPAQSGEAIGILKWMTSNLDQKQHPAGHYFVYNSCLTNVLLMLLEAVYADRFVNVFERELYSKLGAEQAALINTDAFDFPIIEGQISLCLRDFARLAYVCANDGVSMAGDRIVPSGFFADIAQPNESLQAAYHADEQDALFPCGQYHNQFWGFDPTKRQFSMLGIHGQFAWVDLERDLVICGLGSYPQQDSKLMMQSLKALWDGIAVLLD